MGLSCDCRDMWLNEGTGGGACALAVIALGLGEE
jgi:hypothetical protein